VSDIRWVRIESWHLIEATTLTRETNVWMVTTRCGIVKPWDQTFLDRLPGGDEQSCENCLALLAGDVDDPAPKKRSRKAK
jgi:hypothetical protein